MRTVALLLCFGGAVFAAAPRASAVSYQAVDLPRLGGSESYANGINDQGQVAGWSGTAGGYYHAFLWQNGTMTDLGTLPGGWSSSACGINNLGQVVGESLTADGLWHAVLWTPVPEPSSLLALLCGLGAMAGIVRCRRR